MITIYIPAHAQFNIAESLQHFRETVSQEEQEMLSKNSEEDFPPTLNRLKMRFFSQDDFIKAKKIGPVQAHFAGGSSNFNLNLLSDDSLLEASKVTGCPKGHELRSRLEAVLQGLSKIRGFGEVSPLHQKIFGPIVDGRLYLQWFLERVEKIKFDIKKPKTSHAKLEDLKQNKSNIYLSCEFYDLDNHSYSSLEFNQGILLHEARHVEQGSISFHYSYLPERDKLTDQFPMTAICVGTSCDSYSTGPQGVSAIFHATVAKLCTSCSFEERENHYIAAIGALSNITDPEGRKVLIQQLFNDDWVLEFLGTEIFIL